MIFDCACKFIGKEIKQSKKGNSYIVVSLIQGTSVLTVMSEVDINCEFGKEIIVSLQYDLRYKNLKLVGARNGNE